MSNDMNRYYALDLYDNISGLPAGLIYDEVVLYEEAMKRIKELEHNEKQLIATCERLRRKLDDCKGVIR